MATPVISHFCNVVYGEGLDDMARDVMSVDTAAQTQLYSGRLFHPDSNGRGVKGISGAGAPIFIAHRGVDHTDVAGLLPISGSLTGAILGHTGYGMISGIPLRPGIRIQTSEYITSDTYAINTPVGSQTATGQWRACAGSAGVDTIGFVAVTPKEISGINVLDIRIVEARPTAPEA